MYEKSTGILSLTAALDQFYKIHRLNQGQTYLRHNHFCLNLYTDVIQTRKNYQILFINFFKF